MRSPWIALEGPKSSRQCLYKRQRERTCTHRRREVICRCGSKNEPQDKGCMESPEIQEEEKKGDSPLLETSRAAWPCRHLDSRAERIKFCCLSHQTCGICYTDLEEPDSPRVGLYSVGTPSCHQSQQVNTFHQEQGRSDVGDEGSQKGGKASLGREHSSWGQCGP